MGCSVSRPDYSWSWNVILSERDSLPGPVLSLTKGERESKDLGFVAV